MSRSVLMKVYRGEQGTGALHDYQVPIDDGMVVLDVIHRIQATEAPDLACRWNCKAGKCGSCSAEVNGKPALMCMTRMDTLNQEKPITVEPLQTFPHVRDLVTDVSWNYTVNKKIQPFTPRPKDADGKQRMYQYEVDRVQEFRKCIECFLCQDVCHVLRNHGKHEEFAGPRFMARLASLEMHPLDVADRLKHVKDGAGVGFCNITKCCSEVCPEHIHITDNAIIPLKERVADRFYDPLQMLFRVLGGK
ncbi:MAG: succinate dehydrogenase/fumarate reductase iron-sulfur subunit [bacterium]|nr:succinate dehydrogenase/fumarate reductase iron-sulfur subunit [bacterium]MBK8130242.1 succinate dehydrogenase/fumarate reductase iron-sulfur subunit [bacterium]